MTEGWRNELKYDAECEWWEGEKRLSWLGEPTVLRLYADASGPSPTQLRLWKQIVERRGSLRSQLEATLADYYNREVFGQLDVADVLDWFEGNTVPAPELTKPADIWKLVDCPSIAIEAMDHREPVRFAVEFACDWDHEHGISVWIEDWRVAML